MMTFQFDRSVWRQSGSVINICKIVGTQWEKVIFSVLISSRIFFGSYLPG